MVCVYTACAVAEHPWCCVLGLRRDGVRVERLRQFQDVFGAFAVEDRVWFGPPAGTCSPLYTHRTVTLMYPTVTVVLDHAAAAVATTAAAQSGEMNTESVCAPTRHQTAANTNTPPRRASMTLQ